MTINEKGKGKNKGDQIWSAVKTIFAILWTWAAQVDKYHSAAG